MKQTYAYEAFAARADGGGVAVPLSGSAVPSIRTAAHSLCTKIANMTA